MKKMTYFVMALALVLGLAQCKKEQPLEAQGEQVRINLNVDGGASTGSATNGSRAQVVPPSVNFVDGDLILVASDGHYVGTLTKNGENFSGDITNPAEGEPLYFYFLGNKQGTLANGATSCTVNISDQTTANNMPVISMGKSTEEYTPGVATYSSKLYNKASLMKFDVTTGSNATICITGMNNLVTVDFGKHEETGTGLAGSTTNNGFSYSMDEGDGGLIKMAGNSGSERWAIVLPQGELPKGGEGTAFTDDGVYTGNRPKIYPIDPNNYYSENDDVVSMELITFTELGTPLTFEAKTAGTVIYIYCYPAELEYSTDDGLNWEPLDYLNSWVLENVGDKVSFRGDNAIGCEIECEGEMYVYGNIMSLLYPNDYATATTLSEAYAFNSLFRGTNYHLYSHPDKELLLPATTLTEGCYQRMFLGCDNLTKAPKLPATTLAEHCYEDMFAYCTSLETAPELPATTLAEYCYLTMFYGCTSLTTAPELPATTLKDDCYNMMFYGCTSLTTAPTLPATTLVNSCYMGMFTGCSSLNSITCLATDPVYWGETDNWVNGVASNGTFYKAAGADWWSSGNSGIPEGWTVVEVR